MVEVYSILNTRIFDLEVLIVYYAISVCIKTKISSKDILCSKHRRLWIEQRELAYLLVSV